MALMKKICGFLDQYLYESYANNWDDELFRQRVIRELPGKETILDFGAGAGIVTQANFHGLVERVIGVDFDRRVLGNPFLDDAAVLTSPANLPLPDQSVELVISTNVMEHLQSPEEEISEIYRVLKPGGKLIFKTPNKYHYMPLVARITPLRFHKWVNRQRGREIEDTFPTVYKCNCMRDIERISKNAGFSVPEVSYYEGRPEYMRRNLLLYLLGALYERVVNSAELLEQLRVVMIVTLTKKA